MSDTIICVLRMCSCGHPESEHDGPYGTCAWIVEANDLSVWICECPCFQPAPDESRP